MKKIGDKAQGTVEFIIIFGFILMFFTVFFAIIQMNINDKNKEKERIIIQNVALDVQDEINLAAEASEGYCREFKIPSNILGKDYEINVSNAHVVVVLDGFTSTYKSHQVIGEINKTLNIIRKQNGQVYLN